MGKKLFTFFVYSNFFVAGCAVLMVDQTYRLLLNDRINFNYLSFVFFSTICSYSFHWYLTSSSLIPSPRIEWVNKNRKIHFILFLIGLAGSGIFFFYLLPHWNWLLIAVFITFLYSAPKIPIRLFRMLRKVALGKTVFLALVWMYVTTILPVIISEQEWKTGFILFAISRFFFIYIICILFDYRDKLDDIAAGVKSLITYLNEREIEIMIVLSLIAFFLVTVMMYWFGYPLLSVILLLIPGIIIAFIYKYAMRNFSDTFYYVILDGLMAFSSLLMLIRGI